MFERRLKVLLVLMALPVVAVVLRLVQLQIVDASEYREDIRDHLLLKPVVYSPPLRGDIVDHDGQNRLAYDAPAWSICIEYHLLAGEDQYLTKLAMKRYRTLDSDAQIAALQRDIAASWQIISQVSGKSIEELDESVHQCRDKVEAVKQLVEKRRGVQTVVAEENMPQAVVRGLDQAQQTQARDRLRGYEWVSVVSDQRRLYSGGASMGHLLGRLGKVGPEDVARQNYANTPLGDLYEYVSGDVKGTSGLELMGERWLRGHRGRRREDINGNLVDDPPHCDPLSGKAMRMTIDLPLQQKVYEILEQAIKGRLPGLSPSITQYCTGGAAVILDVPSREVLAIVSYPGYEPNITSQQLAALDDDELRQPTIFRALKMRYPPGSTVKPMLLAAGLTDGTISPDTEVICIGHLDPKSPNRFRCTAPHGRVNTIFAIQHSCNVFFYKLGAKMGSKRLAAWMSQFGLGHHTGTGFPREAQGHLPEGNDFGGHAMLGAIGQDKTDATPIQIANMMATLASGVFRPVSLWADDPTPRPTRAVMSPEGRPISSEAWREAREGMYEVVNVPKGTAYGYATLTGTDDFILIGKTGSATGARRAIMRNYVCHLKDGRTIEEVAPGKFGLEEKYPDAVIKAGEATSKCPPEGTDPTHAWFAGYLTTKQHYLESNNAGKLNVAIAVIVEFSGHGGTGAGPIAREMAKAVLQRAGEHVDMLASPVEPVSPAPEAEAVEPPDEPSDPLVATSMPESAPATESSP